jgi:phosphatidylinositol glycan class B
MRPWLQPGLYTLVGAAPAALGLRSIWHLATVFRFVTAAANLAALGLFLRTVLGWLEPEARRLQLRSLALFSFLPYLFVRTSSESGSMAAFTAAFALLFEPGSSVPTVARGRGRRLLVGLLLGTAFEIRFQTAFITLGILAWVAIVAREARRLGPVALGGAITFAAGRVADRWGYGELAFTPWNYFRVNLLEGAAKTYGTDPPFAYLWTLPANVFFPVVVALLALAVLSWIRAPRHPLTWATLPFFLVHNLMAHKEERFLFPLAIFAIGFVPLALAPAQGTTRIAVVERIAAWGWNLRERRPPAALAVLGVIPAAVVTFFPLGWHVDVRFTRALHDRFGEEVHAVALPGISVAWPPFHPRVYDVANARPDEIVAALDAGSGPRWLIADEPVLRTGTALDGRATLVYSELPGHRDPEMLARLCRLVDGYNAFAKPPLRRLHYRSLYELR